MTSFKKIFFQANSITPYFLSAIVFYLITFIWLLTLKVIAFHVGQVMDIVGYSMIFLLAVFIVQIAIIALRRKLNKQGISIISILLTLTIIFCGIINVGVIEFVKTYPDAQVIKADAIESKKVCDENRDDKVYYLASAIPTSATSKNIAVYCPAKIDSFFLLPSSDDVMLR